MSRVPADSEQGSAWRGGHFVPVEEPELYAEELRAFFRPCRAATG